MKESLATEASALVTMLRQNHDSAIQNLLMVTEKHIKRKDVLFATFLGYLYCNDNFATLVDKYPDPKDPGTLVSRFFLYTRGPKNRVKYNILNRSLICFVQNHKMGKAASRLTDTHTHRYEYHTALKS